MTEQIQNSRDGRQLFETLQKDHKFKPEYLDVLYNFAKFQYECGNYSGAAEYLYFHRWSGNAEDQTQVSTLSWLYFGGKRFFKIAFVIYDYFSHHLSRVLAPPSDKNFMNALWGKLASEILMQNWDTALEGEGDCNFEAFYILVHENYDINYTALCKLALR